jgi:Ca-activated chloride channel family protein
MAAGSFNTKEKKYKAVVLITDGEDHDEGALPAAQSLAENGVVIHTIGIGTPSGAPIIDPVSGIQKVEENGSPVISKLNEPELKHIAAAGN